MVSDDDLTQTWISISTFTQRTANIFLNIYYASIAVNMHNENCFIGDVYSVRQKKVSPKVFCHFLSNRLEFLHEISHTY